MALPSVSQLGATGNAERGCDRYSPMAANGNRSRDRVWYAAMSSNQSYLTMFFAQIAGQAPLLLAYVVGMVVCAVCWRRASQAAMLAMLGLGIMLLTSLAVPLIQNQMILNRSSRGGSYTSLSQVFFWIGMITSLLRAAATGLLVAGVFVGRPKYPYAAFEVQPFNPQPPPFSR
jgi:hypothetical protein